MTALQRNNESPDKPLRTPLQWARKALRELRWARIVARNFGKKISRGKNCTIGPSSEIYTPEYFTAGENVSIGSFFLSQTNVEIGDQCLLSSRVSFIGNDHDLFDQEKTAYFSGRLPPSKVILEGDNFIGYGASILGNVRVGKGSVVAAFALVTRDVPPGVVVSGIPAKVVRNRFCNV